MKTVLITGANRGIGLEFARQLKAKKYYVIGCCRNPAAAKELNAVADEIYPLDVTNDNDITELRRLLNGKPIDLLINNAGISGERGVTVGNVNRANFIQILDVNCVSVLKVCDALLSNVEASKDKSIVAISSRMGSIEDNTSGRSYAYRASKAALNCAMKSFAIDVESRGIHVMLMHPGWVKTDLGGQDAPIELHTSVEGMIQQIEKHISQSHGEKMYQFDGAIIPW